MTGGGQMDLFGRPAGGGSRRRSRPVGPAPVPDEIAALAGELPPGIRLGTSSWSFPGWEGIVYDRAASPGRLAREGLRAYARHPLFRAVGVDRTYYAPLPAAAFAEYADAVPEGFRFLVKAPASTTTPWARDDAGRPEGPNPLFLDPVWAAAEAVEPCLEGLGGKTGAVVFQFPPLGRHREAEPGRFADRIGTFLAELPRGPLYAVEVRDRTLVTPSYFDALAATGAVHCFGVHPRMPTPAAQREVSGSAVAGPLVARWMLHAGLGYDQARLRYGPFSRLVDEDPSSRDAIAELCVDHALAGHPVLVTANNKAEGSAPLTLYRLAGAIVEILRRRQRDGSS